MDANIRHLDQFVCVVERGSITKAAQTLHMSQPAITKSLQLLEQKFGVTLVLRNRNGVRLTVFGKCLYKHAKRIKNELSRTTEEMQELLGAHEGIVSVGAIPTVARRLLPTAILGLEKSRPEIVVSVTEKSYPELVSNFNAGEFDFITGILDQENLDPAYVKRTLFYDEVLAVVRARHPLTKLERVTPKDLLRYPWIYPNRGGIRRKRIDNYFYSLGLTPPKATIEGSSTSLKLAVLLKSDMVTALPESFVRSDENETRLKAIKLNPPILRRPIGVIHRGSKNLSPAVRALLAEIEIATKRSVEKVNYKLWRS